MPPRQASPAAYRRDTIAVVYLYWISLLHRRAISWYRAHTTTPSSFACHPSTGGECHPVRLRRRVQTRYDCSSVSVLVISPPQERNCRVQIRCHHPVGLRPPPLRRRGMPPPRRASPATPPQERNCRVQIRCDCSSVPVLVISPSQEGNDLPLRFMEYFLIVLGLSQATTTILVSFAATARTHLITPHHCWRAWGCFLFIRLLHIIGTA